MTQLQVQPIGTIHVNEKGTYLEVAPKYRDALQGLEGFSHLQLIWWFSQHDETYLREVTSTPCPYKKGPDIMGIFATRSPVRPNPLAISSAEILNIDYESGIIQIVYTDAFDNTPLLDIKPYTPSEDRIVSATVPSWCAHWPKNYEESGEFDWENEFNS